MKVGVNLINFGPGGSVPSMLQWARIVEALGGKTEQFVVRVYGDTGKTSIMRFDFGRRQWVAL